MSEAHFKELIYSGVNDSVEINVDGLTLIALRGKKISVPTEIANGLLLQDTWAEPHIKEGK